MVAPIGQNYLPSEFGFGLEIFDFALLLTSFGLENFGFVLENCT